MDDKQLNESLSLFYIEAPSKKGEEYSKSSLISFFFFFFFWTYLRNCFVKSFTEILPICNDFKSSSQNWRRFHLHSRFVPIRVCSCKEKIDVHICLSAFVFLVHKIVKNELFVLLKKPKKDCVLSIRRKLKKKIVKWRRLICNLIVSEQVRASVFAFLFYKRTCSSCIVELYKQLGIFKNTPEVREALACGSCFRHFSRVLKNHSARFLFL